MKKRILVVGGYGNFGQFIARRLAREPDITVIVAGRSVEKARALAEGIGAEATAIDVPATVDLVLQSERPDIVIQTSGPFQDQGYEVAEACVRYGAHYIDLADGRAFVSGITQLDEAAEAKNLLIVSGASSVPGLTSAIIDCYAGDFQNLEEIDYGIATAHKTNGGLATAKAVLSYAGKPFATLTDGSMRRVYGWQGLRWKRLPTLGWRPLGYCDVPDLELFPRRYPSLKTIRFGAGLEMPLVHLSLWTLSWLARIGAVGDLSRAARSLLFLSRQLDWMGGDVSGFFMEMTGLGAGGRPARVTFQLVAKSGAGVVIPCIPAIVTALGLMRGQITARGAMPCMGLAPLNALLEELKPFDIHWSVTRTPAESVT